ncbi:MAG TPA: ABC transporter ATP-binding protein [Gemmatimonadaceae bacterium]|nr:ABC transporter ATP-binding protein [Gemmatimonadaceae bacterium]
MIEFDNVTKVYRPLLGRAVRAVEDFSLRIEPGEVLGLAGPNGAGKSTLIALLLGYLHPTSGRVTIDGRPPRQYVERVGIGYLSELVAITPHWTLEGALQRFAILAGITDGELRAHVERVIARLGLEEHRAKKVKHLSKGNLQRLGLAQALLRDDVIMIFDEPTHGLDPVWTQNFRELVDELRRPDRVLFVASHNLDELERIADRVVIIDHGRVRRTVDMRRPDAHTIASRYRLGVAEGHEHVTSIFPDARRLDDWHFEITARDASSLNEALATLIARGTRITELTPAYAGLERHFREAVSERQPRSE